ncbi:MAG: hypothetical protein ACJ70T_10195 [Nitrososphaera sp.]
MLKCKSCGEIFPGIYVPEDNSKDDFKLTVTTSDTSHTCSRGHNNQYITEDYMDWS